MEANRPRQNRLLDSGIGPVRTVSASVAPFVKVLLKQMAAHTGLYQTEIIEGMVLQMAEKLGVELSPSLQTYSQLTIGKLEMHVKNTPAGSIRITAPGD